MSYATVIPVETLACSSSCGTCWLQISILAVEAARIASQTSCCFSCCCCSCSLTAGCASLLDAAESCATALLHTVSLMNAACQQVCCCIQRSITGKVTLLFQASTLGLSGLACMAAPETEHLLCFGPPCYLDLRPALLTLMRGAHSSWKGRF
jgi:hypothetical protein